MKFFQKQSFSLFILVFFFLCIHQPSYSKIVVQDSLVTKNKVQKSANALKENPYMNAKIDVSTFKNKDGSWGYDIMVEGKKVIAQPNIPAVAGTKGFNTCDEAKEAGTFAAKKIRNNIMPPTVNKQELDSLGVLK